MILSYMYTYMSVENKNEKALSFETYSYVNYNFP